MLTKFFNLDAALFASLAAVWSLACIGLLWKKKFELNTIKSVLSDLNSKSQAIERKISELATTTSNQLASNKAVGLWISITDSHPWHFEGTVRGWNPNWSLELSQDSQSQMALDMKKMHIDRLKSSKVDNVQYVFLEGFKLPFRSDLKFGAKFFLEYLNKTLKDEVKSHVHKYSIWAVPESTWKTVDGATDSELARALTPQLDSIFISGLQNAHHTALVFPHNPQFLAANGHSHCLRVIAELPNYNSIFTRIVDLLEQNDVREQKVVCDHSNKYILSHRLS